jgi:hypothetical protein
VSSCYPVDEIIAAHFVSMINGHDLKRHLEIIPTLLMQQVLKRLHLMAYGLRKQLLSLWH